MKKQSQFQAELIEFLEKRRSSKPSHSNEECVSEALLAGYIDGTISSDQRTMMEHHLASCNRCLDTVALVMKMENDADSRPESRKETYHTLDNRKLWRPSIRLLSAVAASAAIFGFLFQLLHFYGLLMQHPVLYIMISFSVFINLILAIFNLVPIPPLDGSKIVGGLIPLQYQRLWEAFERKGMFILLGLIMIGFMLRISIFRPIFWMANFVFLIITGERSPFG